MAKKEKTQEIKLRILNDEYAFPSFDTLSFKEAKRIKEETGLVMGRFYAALEVGDPDALLAIALLAKLREDPNYNVEELYELTLSDVEIVIPEPEPVPAEEGPGTPLGSSEPSKPAKTAAATPSIEEKSLVS